MNVMPMEGGLRLAIETALEWEHLEQIPMDAMGDEDGDGKLAERLGALMDEASDWEDVVIPELRVYFSEQLGLVARAVGEARKHAVDEPDEEGELGKIYIKRSEAEAWYGALNQARLALESRYRFGAAEQFVVEEFSGFPQDKLRGFLRMRLYSGLQMMLLDYAMD